jgi:predicted phosphoribosyltransferase
MEEDFKLKAIFNLYGVGGEHNLALGTLQIDKEGSLVDLTSQEQTEIDAEVIRLQAEYDSQEYARNRKTEYPDIGDQLDMIYHNGDGGATFQAAIKAVKDKYPKE